MEQANPDGSAVSSGPGNLDPINTVPADVVGTVVEVELTDEPALDVELESKIRIFPFIESKETVTSAQLEAKAVLSCRLDVGIGIGHLHKGKVGTARVGNVLRVEVAVGNKNHGPTILQCDRPIRSMVY